MFKTVENGKFGEIELKYSFSRKENDLLYWAVIRAIENETDSATLKLLNKIRDDLMEGEDNAFELDIATEKPEVWTV